MPPRTALCYGAYFGTVPASSRRRRRRRAAADTRLVMRPLIPLAALAAASCVPQNIRAAQCGLRARARGLCGRAGATCVSTCPIRICASSIRAPSLMAGGARSSQPSARRMPVAEPVQHADRRSFGRANIAAATACARSSRAHHSRPVVQPRRLGALPQTLVAGLVNRRRRRLVAKVTLARAATPARTGTAPHSRPPGRSARHDVAA